MKIPGTCEVCDGEWFIGGPIWSEHIHNEVFVKNLLDLTNLNKDKFNTTKRIKGILEGILLEL